MSEDNIGVSRYFGQISINSTTKFQDITEEINFKTFLLSFCSIYLSNVLILNQMFSFYAWAAWKTLILAR